MQILWQIFRSWNKVDNHIDDWRAWNGSSKIKKSEKRHTLLPHMKVIAFQGCERIVKTINEVRKKHVATKSIILGMASALNESSVTTVMLVLEH